MKKHIFLSLFVLLLSASLVTAQKREVKLAAFTKIGFGFPGKLYLRQGNTQKVEIEGDKEVLEKATIEVDGDKLVISQEEKWFSFWDWNDDNHKITVYVTVVNIDAISVSGSGTIIGETKLTATSLDTRVSGSGSLQIEAAVNNELEANVSGSGRINLKCTAKNFDSNVSGSGKIEVTGTISDRADFSISGSGKIEASGVANAVKTSISGSGKLLAANLETNTCDVRISGSGNVEINVTNNLDVRISGSGNVAYKGNPNHLNTSSSGSGSIRKL
jgi:hypothetical protein